jgi:exportin-7
MVGGYCCFGVFEIYKDDSFKDLLSVIINYALSINLSEIQVNFINNHQQYSKLNLSLFTLFDTLFEYHLDTLLQLNNRLFMSMLFTLENSMKNDDNSITTKVFSSLDNFLTFYILKVKKNSYSAKLINQHLSENQSLLPKILTKLFNFIIFEDYSNQWSISRVMLSLIVINPKVKIILI